MDEGPGRGVELADEAFCWTLARLVFLGARAMLALQRRDGPAVDFEEWRAAVLREAPELGEVRVLEPSPQLPLFDERGRRRDGGRSATSGSYLVTWLWDALSRRTLLQHAAPAARPSAVEVLPAGSAFRFELGGSVPSDVRAVIQGPLLMRAGKRGRLECQPVETRLEIGDEPAITVGSLNEAYTAASQRREPHRRSHTGNVYQRVLWVADGSVEPLAEEREVNGERVVRLEQIRGAVARGVWRSPSVSNG